MQVIKEQFKQMLLRGKMPYFEYQLNNGEFLLCELKVTDKGIEFSFDNFGLKSYFDGEILGDPMGTHFILPFNSDFENLNSYLEFISDNLTNGFICANDLQLD